MTDAARSYKADDIAIIGMAGRFPGAPDVDTFWTNLRDGVESIRRLTDAELLSAGVSRRDLDDPDYVKASPVLDDVDKFDAAFFGFSPREAAVMDPAHRLFLEVAWQAVEHSGYTALPEEGPVGVFAGAGAPLYMIENLRSNPELIKSMGEFLVRHTGNDMNFLATRVSYEMDLRGPSMNVQTACSSALVAVHTACQALVRGDCTMALAGGSTVLFPQAQGYHYRDGEILSPDGHCRPFDAKSAGTVFGSGAGVVVLKRLQDALDDGDTIHAVIKASAINNDGAMKVGYLAPGVEGQAAVIGAALKAANVAAESISYIETHGTGTLVGDPIEVEALNEAFRPLTDKRHYCAIGSVKSNIGHLGEAAGAASLIKAVMALKHRQLPPSLGFEVPNPAIDFEDSPFFVNGKLREWRAAGPLRCGVTALGAGGTNCHVILEEPPVPLPGEGARSQQLLVLSAATNSALDAACENLATALESDTHLDLADAAFTLAVGRRPMAHRFTLAVSDRADAVRSLRDRPSKRAVREMAGDAEPKTVFMFPGGGAQYAGMGQELYEQEDVYREAVDACLEIITPALGTDLRPLMFPVGDVESATRALERPSFTLPSLFATEYAMARLFQSWGVEPDALIGHSVGEYAAACIAGVMSLEDALRLVMLRGRLFEVVERGSMLSVPLGEAALRALLPPGLDIAAANAPDLSVASGPTAAIRQLEGILAARQIDSTPVRIDVAAHSAMLDPVLEEFRALCRTIRFQPPSIPFVSNVSGKWITPAEATSPDYWVRHLRSTVRFADGISTLQDLGPVALLEVGPGRTLSMLAKAQANPVRHAFNCMRHPQEKTSDLACALTSVGSLWCAGVKVDWPAFYDGQLRNRVPLPTYPFERKSYWIAPGKSAPSAESTELSKRADISDWFYNTGFVEEPLVRAPLVAKPSYWLVLADTKPAADALARALGNEKVIVAVPGPAFRYRPEGYWCFDWNDPEQYVQLIQSLEEHSGVPQRVVLVLGAEKRSKAKGSATERNFLHPTWLMRALGELAEPVQVSVVTSGLGGIGGRPLEPARALALGPVRVTPREFSNLSVRCIDVPNTALNARGAKSVLARLADELRAPASDSLVALSADNRWVQRISPLSVPPLTEEGEALSWVRDGGVYFITGGLGGIGLEVAHHLARTKPVKLALLAREALPPESRWDQILAGNTNSRTAQRIAQVRSLRALGAEVLVVHADVADEAALGLALSEVRRTFGPLNGVIHAAGIMDDAPMLTKDATSMQRVLAPKVAGTLALDARVNEPLDVFILFSSVASALGLPGQVDYTAANAFQDTFARLRAATKPGRTLVINWNAWRDVGMAAGAYREQTQGITVAHPSQHPAFDGYSDSGRGRTFVATLSAENNWMLGEHVVKNGPSVLPGTGFVELARAAFAEGRSSSAIELTDLSFIAPFRLKTGQTRALTVRLEPEGDHHTVAMYDGPDMQSPPIVVGEARACNAVRPVSLDIAALRQRCASHVTRPEGGRLEQDFMNFGPRWANIRRISFGSNEALIELSLDAQYSADLAHYALHPALLDMATGGAQALIPGVNLAMEFYVPLAYGAVRIYAPMPGEVFSHVRCLPDTGHGVAYFDVTLSGPDGVVFAEISRFTMRRLDERTSLGGAAAEPVARRRPPNDPLEESLREGISVPEGLDALDRALAQPSLIQVAICSVDLPLWARKLAASAPTMSSSAASSEPVNPAELPEGFVAPSNSAEVALAKIWSDLLGVRHVSTADDFFDLGGNSLTGVRLFAAIRKQFQISLPLATLFEAPTISDLALLLPHDDEPETKDSRETPGLNATGGDKLRKPACQGRAARDKSNWTPLVRMTQGAPGAKPLFLIHGAKGNVLWFKPFADRLKDGSAIYGIEAQGIDGSLPFLETIEEMAALYVRHIQTIDPEGPYRLVGYSGGGVIAVEMAQQLRRLGRKVELLIMLDTLAPQEISRPLGVVDRIGLIGRVGAPYLMRWCTQKFSHFADAARERLGLKPEAAEKSYIEILGDQSEVVYLEAQRRYHPVEYDGDVVIFRAAHADARFVRSGHLLGWQGILTGKADVITLDAHHDNLLAEPAVHVVVAEVRRRIEALNVQAPPALEGV
jgi:acyl transferase domain-containing protein/thioesterase domain-containing protein